LALAIGGFGLVGLFCLTAAVLAAATVTRVQMRKT
jgi:hypothetical protein